MTQREFPSCPLVGVGAVVVDDLGRVLLIQRGNEPRKGHWSIPGGLVELGETLTAAVEREVAEEAGLQVRTEAMVEVLDRIYFKADRVRYHYVLIDYWCSVVAGTAAAGTDAADVAWAGRVEWTESNPYSLEEFTIAVIEKGWQMAQETKRGK